MLAQKSNGGTAVRGGRQKFSRPISKNVVAKRQTAAGPPHKIAAENKAKPAGKFFLHIGLLVRTFIRGGE